MASFQYKSSSDIAQAQLLTDLRPLPELSDKSRSQTWSCAFSPDESCFAWSCGNRYVVLVAWDSKKSCPVENKQENENESRNITIDCGYIVWSLAFGSGLFEDRNNRNAGNKFWIRNQVHEDLILATGLSNSRIRIWDVKTGKLILELMGHKDIVQDLAFAPDNSLRLVSASRDCSIKVWDLTEDGNLYKTLPSSGKSVLSVAWSPNSQLLASVGCGKTAFVWNMQTYTLHVKLEGHHHDVTSCDFSNDGAILATGSCDSRILLWDPITGEVLKVLGHLFPFPSMIYASGANGAWVKAVAFSKKGNHIASVAEDGYIRIWDLFSEEEDPVQINRVEEGLCCTFAPSGLTLAVGNSSGCITFWAAPVNVPNLQQLCRFTIRSFIPSTTVPLLDNPICLQKFLQYKDLI